MMWVVRWDFLKIYYTFSIVKMASVILSDITIQETFKFRGIENIINRLLKLNWINFIIECNTIRL